MSGENSGPVAADLAGAFVIVPFAVQASLERALSRRRWIRILFTSTLLTLGCHAGNPTEPPIFPTQVPVCANPAPLLGVFDPRAPHILVGIRGFFSVPLAAASLAGEYGLTVIAHLDEDPRGFIASGMTPETVAALRCEPVVLSVEFDAIN